MLTASTKPPPLTLYTLATVALIVGLDLSFFQNRYGARFAVSIGIVLAFAAFSLFFYEVVLAVARRESEYYRTAYVFPIALIARSFRVL